MSQPVPIVPGDPSVPPQTQYAPPKKKSKAPLIIGIVAAVVLVLCGGVVACIAVVGTAVNDAARSLPTGLETNPAGGANPGASDPGPETTPPGNDDPAPVAVGLNQPARDGKFEFTVTKVQCGVSQVGSGFLIKKAQGQFCKVYIKVKNIGDEARTFSDSNQYAYNAAGQRYDADGEAGIYLGEESNAFLEDINPGNSVSGIVIFDIPKGAKIVKLELHDSAFSGGVVVNV